MKTAEAHPVVVDLLDTPKIDLKPIIIDKKLIKYVSSWCSLAIFVSFQVGFEALRPRRKARITP